MPELPEVETVCRGLANAVTGRRIERAVARRPDLRIALPADLSERLEGRRVAAIRRRAKYILVELDDDTVVIAHLGMSGRMAITNGAEPAGPPGPHDHVLLDFDGGVAVRFNDARRFGLLTLSNRKSLASHPLLADIGPEPLGNEFNGPYLADALEGRRTPIKAALLDQKIVAGLGNIYVSEALYHSGISPRRQAANIGLARAERLVRAVKRVLTDAIESGGSSLRDYVQPTGELGYFQHRWAVYGREGEPCPDCTCDTSATGGVRRIVQSNRSTFYCPLRQR